MQLAVRVHTAGFEQEVRRRCAGAFAEMVAITRDDVQMITGLARSYSPVASGQMQEAISVFEDSPVNETQGVDAHRFVFGLGETLRGHEVRFERDRVKVHTAIEDHFFEDGRHCSDELAGPEELRVNPNAMTRPLTHAMVEVWGESMVPTNAKAFKEGQLNVMEFEPLLPRVESSSWMDRLREAVRRMVS